MTVKVRAGLPLAVMAEGGLILAPRGGFAGDGVYELPTRLGKKLVREFPQHLQLVGDVDSVLDDDVEAPEETPEEHPEGTPPTERE